MPEGPDAFAIEPSPSGRLLCGGCAPHDSRRPGVEIADAQDDKVRFDVICPPFWHGGPGVAHGGWKAAVFDDVLSVVALRVEPRLVTTSLSISCPRPVPVERPAEVLARIDRHAGRQWKVSADTTLIGTVSAIARTELRTRHPHHVARHEAWLARQPMSPNGSHAES
ncbi:PaaI family thioesterase [Streptomyces sp. S465]|uniref:PaaI family thioesterase n=1 Tax=Streptomyces sp. S465 TaxID=2979468 RepID=UPI0022A88471|nr:PaaI family thioesterase [Streptomyces sp. S465]WAP59153.1 PaaI family thioesterase [Streptomyces sp. S465]